MSGLYKDLTGQRFNRLTVIGRAGSHGSRACWRCLCDCGKETIVETADLKSGNTKSCGCFRQEQTVKRSVKYRQSGNRLYLVWIGMKKRCDNPTSTSYEYYGGRGIKVCSEWEHNFSAFRDWAIQNDYEENAKRGECTIDRIDGDGDYCPENCRWVSMKEQALNKRVRYG